MSSSQSSPLIRWSIFTQGMKRLWESWLSCLGCTKVVVTRWPAPYIWELRWNRRRGVTPQFGLCLWFPYLDMERCLPMWYDDGSWYHGCGSGSGFDIGHSVGIGPVFVSFPWLGVHLRFLALTYKAFLDIWVITVILHPPTSDYCNRFTCHASHNDPEMYANNFFLNFLIFNTSKFTKLAVRQYTIILL